MLYFPIQIPTDIVVASLAIVPSSLNAVSKRLTTSAAKSNAYCAGTMKNKSSPPTANISKRSSSFIISWIAPYTLSLVI